MRRRTSTRRPRRFFLYFFRARRHRESASFSLFRQQFVRGWSLFCLGEGKLLATTQQNPQAMATDRFWGQQAVRLRALGSGPCSIFYTSAHKRISLRGAQSGNRSTPRKDKRATVAQTYPQRPHQVAGGPIKKSGGNSQDDGERSDYGLAVALQYVASPIDNGPNNRYERARKSGAVLLSLLGAAMLAGLLGYLITGRQQWNRTFKKQPKRRKDQSSAGYYHSLYFFFSVRFVR